MVSSLGASPTPSTRSARMPRAVPAASSKSTVLGILAERVLGVGEAPRDGTIVRLSWDALFAV